MAATVLRLADQLYLSHRGHDVTIVDNLSRRKIDVELEVDADADPTALRAAGGVAEISGREIRFEYLTVGDNYHRLLTLIREEKPDAIVHFAEQRAPYSMKSSWHKRYTVNNNLNATNDVLCAIVGSREDVHLVHLGTMGVYGYGSAGMKIPEGYLKVKLDTDAGSQVEQEISIRSIPAPSTI